MKHHRILLPLLLAFAAVSPLSAAEAPASAPSTIPAYPFTTCLVSGEALGSMGDTFVHIYKEEGKPDREIRLCCKGCLKKFVKEPAKYLGKLDGALAPSAEKKSADAHIGHTP